MTQAIEDLSLPITKEAINKIHTPQLVEIYNLHSGRPPIKKFESRIVAVRRIGELIDSPRPMVKSKLSDSIKASWKDPDIAARRSARHGVIVDGIQTFPSVAAAFRMMELPMKECIRFRGKLKLEKNLTAYDHDWCLDER